VGKRLPALSQRLRPLDDMTDNTATAQLFKAIHSPEDFSVAEAIANGADLQARDTAGRSVLAALFQANYSTLFESNELTLDTLTSIESQLLAGGAPVHNETLLNEHNDPLIVRAFTSCFFAVLDDVSSKEDQMIRLNRWLDCMPSQAAEIWGRAVLTQWTSEMVAIGENQDVLVEAIEFGVSVAGELLNRGVPPSLFHEILDEDGDYSDRVQTMVLAFERKARARLDASKEGVHDRRRARP
jgi:hypothetical protein